jgi:uncharacterized protein YjiS (DUF1127 family)
MKAMAYVTTTKIGSAPRADRFGGLMAGIATALQRRRLYAQTVRELNALTDRELADLGISRLSIADVAREAAYGK